MDIRILIGEEVLSIIQNKNFVEQWESLVSKCNKITVIQEYAFVSSWYLNYIDLFDPVLVLGYCSKDKMIGLIPLAFEKRIKRITHAGDYQAEYHGWICETDIEVDFLTESLIKIKVIFGEKSWIWRPCPPGSNLDWVKSKGLSESGIYISMEEDVTPVLDLHNTEKIKSIKKNRSLQTKTNRLGKKGNIYLERIKDQLRGKEIIDLLIAQCDFRHLAVHNVAPFLIDNNKRAFYLELIKHSQFNHFTVLWCDIHPLAFHFGACNSDTVFLGLSGYNPIEEKNSPGNILLVKLIELMQSEGYRFLDLTPGKDTYKEKYATEHQKNYTLKIFFSRMELIVFNCKRTFRKLLIKTSTFLNLNLSRWKEVSILLTDILNSFKKFSYIEFLKFISGFICKKQTFFLMEIDIKEIVSNQKIFQNNTAVNKYSDILTLNKIIGAYEFRKLIVNAFRKFNSDEILLSNFMDGQEIAFGWIARASSFTKKNFEFQKLDLTEKCFLLYDIFSSNNCESEKIMQLVFKGISEAQIQNVERMAVMISINNEAVVEELLEHGFYVKTKITKKSILSRRKITYNKL